MVVEKILYVFSCGIIGENFEIFESNIFYFKVLWMVGEDGIMMVSSFCDVCSKKVKVTFI